MTALMPGQIMLDVRGTLVEVVKPRWIFAVEKVPSLASQAVRTRQRLDAAGVDRIEVGAIMSGRSHGRRTANWLGWTEASRLRRVRYSHLACWEFRVRQALYPLKQKLRGAR